MLKKIDCVMIRVHDVDIAADYYTQIFGLIPKWKYNDVIGLKFPESDTEIVLHNDDSIPSKIDVTYLVKDVVMSVPMLLNSGCEIVAEPFDVQIGKCAVIRDPFGVQLTIIDMTKGPIEDNL